MFRRSLVLAATSFLLVLGLSMTSAVTLYSSSSNFPGAPSLSNSLANHWLTSKNCYRDEVNQSDADYNNCWTDNAGKILVTSELTGDVTDANRSVEFIERYIGSSPDYYLPELAILNGDVGAPLYQGSSVSISNGLVELTAENATSSHFNQLAIGTSYTGNTNLAYIGGDRIWFNNGTVNTAFSSTSSNVFLIPNGFSKVSLFQIGSSSYQVYVNATLAASEPFANVSIQLEPIGSSPVNAIEYLFLQAFNTTSTNPFYSGSLYSTNGSYIESMGYRSSQGISPNSGGILLAYSNATNVFSIPTSNGKISGQDALAIKFGNESIYDWEHWSQDLPFSHSWFAPGCFAPHSVIGNSLSTPIYSEFYPILHFDYNLANDTVKFIASSPSGVAVSPPVSFGFVSYGLALAAASSPSNQTLNDLARGYWNYYYSAYDYRGTDYGIPYARSINLLALAGFKLYGCNSTVESFARDFIGNGSGDSIEEYGWGAAALYQLQRCTESSSDISLYNSFVDSFLTSNLNFLDMAKANQLGVIPGYTFQYGEAASGLMLGGVPYNNPAVLGAMNAVFQSNQSGILLNQPYHGDLANTETIPSYVLSVSLFQSGMRNQTGFWITSLQNANITSIDYSNGTLLIGISGNNGIISLAGNNYSSTIFGVQRNEVLQIEAATTTIVKTVVSVSTITNTIVSTTTTTLTTTMTPTCSECVQSSWSLILIAIAVVLSTGLGFVLAYLAKAKKA